MQNNTVEFMKEYEIMQVSANTQFRTKYAIKHFKIIFQSIDHPNVVRLYGVVLDSTSGQIMLITELAPLR